MTIRSASIARLTSSSDTNGFFAFFLADFLAPNFILGRGLEPDALGGRLRGGPLDVDFDAAAFLVVFLAVFRGDFRVVFLAGMVS